MDIPENTRVSPFREIIDPFINIARAPRALWGLNVTYLIEGMCYFGALTLLTLYFSKNVGLSDAQSGWVVGAFTGGITLAMFFLGDLADRWGVRVALLLSLALMLGGRVLLSAGGALAGGGPLSPMFLTAAGGLLLVVLGYGMYQPAAYSAVRQFTDEKTAAMGYAMLYALMNLGGFLPGLISPPIRAVHGISGMFWFYAASTLLGIAILALLLTRQTVAAAKRLAAGKPAAGARASAADAAAEKAEAEAQRAARPKGIAAWFRQHPLRDARFSFFIFVLIPVQTLFAHQWLTMPLYVSRAFPDWVSTRMETFVNLNPILIFIFTPIVTALTARKNVYTMMIIGTFVMALPTFLLAIGPNVGLLFVYIVISSIGEAMWQPRFLQLAAEIAPPGRTGQYMGIAQFPWFLTKLLTSIYSGTMLTIYCPEKGPQNTSLLWLLYGVIAMASPLFLYLAKGWMGDRLQRKPA